MMKKVIGKGLSGEKKSPMIRARGKIMNTITIATIMGTEGRGGRLGCRLVML